MSLSRRMLIGQALAALMLPARGPAVAAPRSQIRTDRDVDRLLPRVSNWGRWGTDDRRDTLNHITSAHRTAAAKLVRTGRVVSLARETSIADTPGVPEGRHEIHRSELGARDLVGMIPHGFALTHLDALCHVFANPRQLYNGASTDTITARGASELGIDVFGESVVGRGVLLDVAAQTPIEPGTAILVDDLERAERRAGVSVSTGDILFVRTGLGSRNTREKRAGLHPECLSWLHERSVSVLGGDGDNDAYPIPGFERWASAMHSVGIPFVGLPLLDNLDLEPLARACAQERRWQCLVTIAPWRLTGTTSSLVNPLAVL